VNFIRARGIAKITNTVVFSCLLFYDVSKNFLVFVP